MKILISPAKKLSSINTKIFEDSTTCSFLDRSKKIMEVMKKFSAKDLSDLMNISCDLSQLNYNRNQSWKTPISDNQGHQALSSFKGDVYEAMKIEEFEENDIKFAQDHLRILSGLYGMIRASDLILPYRLEMGTKVQIGEHKNLYEFWRETITEHLVKEIEDDMLIINLASNEYFKVIEQRRINTPIITPIFKDKKNGKERVISFYAKKARGAMCNYIIKNKIVDYESIKEFSSLNYRYDDSQSNTDNLVFVRDHEKNL